MITHVLSHLLVNVLLKLLLETVQALSEVEVELHYDSEGICASLLEDVLESLAGSHQNMPVLNQKLLGKLRLEKGVFGQSEALLGKLLLLREHSLHLMEVVGGAEFLQLFEATDIVFSAYFLVVALTIAAIT